MVLLWLYLIYKHLAVGTVETKREKRAVSQAQKTGFLREWFGTTAVTHLKKQTITTGHEGCFCEIWVLMKFLCEIWVLMEFL